MDGEEGKERERNARYHERPRGRMEGELGNRSRGPKARCAQKKKAVG